MCNLQKAVRRHMVGANQSMDRFNPQQATFYTGLQLQHLAEKVAAISKGALTATARGYLEEQANQLGFLSERFKQGHFMGDVGRAEHDKLIAADFDLAFASIGAMYSTAKDGDGAVVEGCTFAQPNFTKFTDPDAKDN